MARQLELFVVAKRRRGKTRGRKPHPDRMGFVPHETRPEHADTHPVHITMRRVALAPSLREQRVYSAIVEQLRAVKSRGVRVIHDSVQPDHLRLMVESHDRRTLSRQMQLLFSRWR